LAHGAPWGTHVPMGLTKHAKHTKTREAMRTHVKNV
jgi:hypothetical protein